MPEWKETEKDIAATFLPYADAEIAFCDIMPIPMAPCGIRGPFPVYVPKGKAPFDVYGYSPQPIFGTDQRLVAIMIGAEIKATSKHHDSLPIVAPDSDSHGLEYHQLDALNNLARCGGYVRLIWSNGGAWGVLKGAGIQLAHAIYEESRASELAGRGKGQKGSRSIPWKQFEPIQHRTIGRRIVLDWLDIEHDGIKTPTVKYQGIDVPVDMMDKKKAA